MSQTEIRELPGWGGKYWLDAKGRVWRRDEGGELYRCAQTGSPPRVRLYRRGKETRRYAFKLFAEVFPDMPELVESVRG